MRYLVSGGAKFIGSHILTFIVLEKNGFAFRSLKPETRASGVTGGGMR